ncbi:LOW QUALITY PROTEIN: nidogen-1-like [Puntigrus tetrazona]|uniref:LOW QUALITY PROTEIN: nidogen-1-like n=1 Tax=Puntigrus tetrazona TaxID=1606681 RepID=UPI001C891260|nr:LOW QUALITY PROTEIN: nidogen-1-like [Puntigrus tetrazona]
MALLRGVGLLALLVSVQSLSREQLFDYGIRFGDRILDSGADSVQELELDQTLFFFKRKFEKVYVSTNGFVSLARPTDESEYLGKMPASFGMIAAFLGNLDTTDGAGYVYFRQDKSPDVLRRAAEHIHQAFPSDDEIEPAHAIIITWENMAPQSERGRGDGDEYEYTRNTFQLVVASTELASYAVLLYPEESMQFGSTLVNDEDQLVEVGFNEGMVTGWFSWTSAQGAYYRITQDSEESISALAQETNSGLPGVWVYVIGSFPSFTSIKPGEVTEVREVTEVTTEQTMVDTPAPEPRAVDSTDPEPPTETSSPEPFAESSTPDEPQYRYVQPRPKTPQQQPQIPQVLIIDEDELNVDVFSYNYETCSSNKHKCSVFADCRDYAAGYCCRCKPGYYGNGKDCVAEGKPQRMNGKVNGRVFVGDSPSPVEFSNNDLHSYVVTNDGRAYIAISSIPVSLGPSLQPLPALGETIGWAFALEQPGFQNGFSIIGGVFTRRAEVVFQPGNERLTVRQEFRGIDEHDHLLISTELDGRIPEVPRGATVQIQPYTEIYQYSSNLITSSSRREYTVSAPDGSVRSHSYVWTQSVEFQSCPHEELPSAVPSQQLSVDQIFVMFDSGNQLIRFAMSNKIGSVHSGTPEQNPCFTGRHGCDTNAACRPAQGKDFSCECAAGFTGDGRLCYDVDECSESPGICGPYSICNNQPGSFRCECLDGFQFGGDGRTCVETERRVDHCRRGTHDCDAPERARCSYTGDSSYVCSCLPGFSGDGRECRDIDECQPGRCHSDAICYNTQGSFTCRCRPGFHGDGFSCTPGSAEGEQTECERHRAAAQSPSSSSGGFFFFRPRPAVGQYVPSCDAYGAYEPLQCHASIGQCWCVDSAGLEVPGSRTGPGGAAPMCIDHSVAPPLIGPTPRPDISPLTPGANLLFAQSGKIDHIPLDGNRMIKNESRTVLHVPGKVVIAVAFDCVEQMIFWSDITQPSISRAELQGGETSLLITKDLGSPEGIAIDHLSRNMYWTDSILDRIEVSRLDGAQRRVLFDSDLINPRPIIADPAHGYLYWSDWNRDGPKIERSALDGSDRTVLVQDGLGLPNALTFDPQSRQLCWADAGTRKVECVDPFSRLRRKLAEGIQYPFAIVSHGRNLYYTDWRREAVVAMDRHDGMEVEEFLPQRRSRTYGIALTYPRCPAGLNDCSRGNGGCSHLCLPRPGGFSCRCPDVKDASCVEPDHNF